MTLPVETRLALEWELWVVEHLLFSARLDDLAGALAEQGVDRSEALAQVERIERNPGFARLKARLGEANLGSRLERLREALVPDVDVSVRATIAADELLERHWIPSRPLKLTDAMGELRALKTWSLQSLAERFPDATVEVNVARQQAARPRETELHAQRMVVPAFVARALAGPSNDLYAVSRNGWLADPVFLALWDDLRPLPPFLVPLAPPRGVSLWVGPEGTITPPHFDPHNVLLVQVQGRKRVRLAPRVRSDQHGVLDGYYLEGPLDQFGDRVRTVVLEPGEALFVPVGWFHEVTALSPSMTLSFLSFPWPNHFHWLGPPGSDDARA